MANCSIISLRSKRGKEREGGSGNEVILTQFYFQNSRIRACPRDELAVYVLIDPGAVLRVIWLVRDGWAIGRDGDLQAGT